MAAALAAILTTSLDTWIGLHPEATRFEGEPELIGPSLGFADGLVDEIGEDDAGRSVVQPLHALSPIVCE